MTRRARRRLLVVLVVLGLPAIAAGLALWYVGSGRLERRIADEYAARLPGELTVGAVEVEGLGSAVLRDVAIGRDGAPVARAARIAVTGSLAGGSLSAVRIEGFRAVIDRDAVAWLGEVVRAAAADAGGDAGAQDVEFALDGSIDVAGALPIEALSVRGDLRGERLRARLTATVAGEPFELVVDARDVEGGIHRSVEVRSAPVRLTPLFTALTRLTDLKDQQDVLGWLPAVAELAGTRLDLAPGERIASGPFVATWHGGAGSGALSLGRDGLRLDFARAEDRQLGQARGSLDLVFRPTRLEVDVPDWRPGPRVPIPEQVPLRELFALMPAAHLVLLEEDDKPRMYLTLAPDATLRSRRQVELRWRKTSPWRVIAGDLPVSLVKGWLPERLRIADGVVDRLEVTIDDGLRFLEARCVGVALAGDDWSFADLAPTLTVEPLADGQGWDARIEAPGVRLRHRGDQRQGRVEISVAALEGVAAHLRGARPAPAIAGAIDAELAWHAQDDGWAGDLVSLRVAGAAAGGSVVGVDLDARGSFAWGAGERSLRLDGRLGAGELRVAGRRVPLATRTPRFTATLADEAGHLVLSDLLTRAEGEGGFTVGLDGRLNRASLDGALAIVVDRADLGWLSSHGELVPMPKKARLAGEMSLTATARIADARVERIDGWLLPLGTDVSLGDGELEISGIKGAIAFRLAPEAPKE